MFDATLGKKLELLVGFDSAKSDAKFKIVFISDDEFDTYLNLNGQKIEDLIIIMDEAD